MSEDDLDAQIRRVDPDRWLASRFVADRALRADLIALYAFNHELARAAEVASQPLVGEMRLAWWREALDEMFEGLPLRKHPAALALAAAVARRNLARTSLEALVDAHLRDLDGWPLGADEALDYIDATAGRLMAVAAALLAPGAGPASVRHAARAWGLAGLYRVGRLPAEWTTAEVGRRVAEAVKLSAPELRSLPVAAFPAVAYAALARGYAQGRMPSELGRRTRLLVSVARGRL
jgi:phytoene synthase